MGFEFCRSIADRRFEEIMEKLGCEEYIGYLTGDGNFRHEVATIKEYKGNRKQPRPFHYENMRNYLQFRYGAKVIHGMEADDALTVEQCNRGDESVIVSRDKDLRMCPGWHYSYPVGAQEEHGPEYISELGYLSDNGKRGGGMMWFYAQCLTGDPTDNIQGLPKAGPKAAVKLLSECRTERQMYDAVLEAYRNVYEDKAEDVLLENARLLWMVRELDSEGNPVMWTPPENNELNARTGV